MPDISITDFISILAIAANLGIALMIIILLGERSHAAWSRTSQEAHDLTMVRETLENQTAEAERVIQQNRDDIESMRSQMKRMEADMEALQRRHRETDLPLGYTSTPVDVVDRRYRTWKVVVRNPELGANAGSLFHPAFRWVEGRLYEIPAANLDMAVMAMQGRFYARDGFQVEPARQNDAAEAVSIEAI